MIEHQDEMIDIFIKYTYPDVKDVLAFCNELCSLIWEYNDDSEHDPGFFLEMLRQMLNFAGKQDKMAFIQNRQLLVIYKHL